MKGERLVSWVLAVACVLWLFVALLSDDRFLVLAKEEEKLWIVTAPLEAVILALNLLTLPAVGELLAGALQQQAEQLEILVLAAIPVIFLTAKSGEADRILGLELGADDYIPKPFSPREMVARVKAVLRRFERPLSDAPLHVGEIEIDPGAMKVAVRGAPITTTATEFRLLEYFARHIGRVFTRDQLLDSVWRDTAYVTPRSVDVYVRRIREKIEADAESPRYLKTMRGAGYRFEIPKMVPAGE